MSEPDQSGSGLPDLSGLLGGLSGGGLGDILAGAQQAMAASQAAAAEVVEGSSGGGVVRIACTGAGEVLSVKIASAVVDPSDVEGLEDLVLAAVRDMNAKIVDLQAKAMGSFDPSSMLGGLGGLFGGGAGSEEE